MITIPYDVRPEEIRAAKAVLRPAATGPLATPIRPMALTTAARRRGPRRGALWYLGSVGIGVAIAAVAIGFEEARGPGPAAAAPMSTLEAVAAGAAVNGILFYFVLALIARALLRPAWRPPLGGPPTLAVDDGGLTISAGAKRRHVPWPTFHSFAETDDAFVVRELPDVGYVVPKRLLADPAAVDYVRARLAAHLSQPPAWVQALTGTTGGFPMDVPCESAFLRAPGDAAATRSPLEPVAPAVPGDDLAVTGAYVPTSDDFYLFGSRWRDTGLPPRRRWLPRPLLAQRALAVVGLLAIATLSIALLASLFLVIGGRTAWVMSLGIAALALGYLLVFTARANSRDTQGENLRAQFDKHPLNGSPAVLRLDDEGFHIASSLGRTDLGYPAIVAVGRIPGLTAVIDPDGLIYSIPDRAFSSPAVAEEFVAALRARACGVRA